MARIRPSVKAVAVMGMLLAEAAVAGDFAEPPVGWARLEAALRSHCGDCHCGGAKEGGLDLEELLGPEGDDGRFPPSSPERDRGRRSAAWSAVWQNIRAGVMPPADGPRPSDAERRRLVAAIETDVFGVDHARPDPGQAILRRLNRYEYANTVRDLTGLDIAVIDDLPDLAGFQVYACGAPIVVDSAKRDYVAQGGLSEEEFFADSFTSEADKAKA
jgi:mono/diheme cytochrome c family protein